MSLYTVGQESDLVKGLYLSFAEFIDNSPRGTDQFYEETKNRSGTAWEGTQSITLHLNETDRKISNVWGYCSGENQYIQHQGDYFPIIKRQDSLLFEGYAQVQKDDWYTGEYQNPADAKRAKSNAIDQARLKRHYFFIDTQTGTVHPIIKGSKFSKPIAMEIVVYRLAKRQRDSTFALTINDGNTTYCTPNSVYSYLVSPETNGATVCLLDQDICVDIPFNPDEPQYIEASLLTSEEIPTIQHVKKEKGEWDSQEIRSELRKSEK